MDRFLAFWGFPSLGNSKIYYYVSFEEMKKFSRFKCHGTLFPVISNCNLQFVVLSFCVITQLQFIVAYVYVWA